MDHRLYIPLESKSEKSILKVCLLLSLEVEAFKGKEQSIQSFGSTINYILICDKFMFLLSRRYHHLAFLSILSTLSVSLPYLQLIADRNWKEKAFKNNRHHHHHSKNLMGL